MSAPVRRVVLGADAWAVLLRAATGLALPPPFDAGGVLTDDQAAAAEAALRASPAVPGRGGGLVADLHPSLRASLLLHLAAPAVLDVAVEDLAARFAVGPALAGGLVRTGRGPVTVLTLLPDAVAAEAAALLPGLGAAPGGSELRLEIANAVAASQALADGRADVAGSLLDGAVPAALGAVTGAARLQVGAVLLLCLRTPDGWRSARLEGPELVLRPLDRDRLVPDLAGALAVALAGALPTGAR